MPTKQTLMTVLLAVTCATSASAQCLSDAQVSDLIANYVAKKPELYAVLDENFGTEEYGVGLRKEDTELLAKIDGAMNAMKQDGTAAKIAQQWFGKDIIK